MKRSASGLILNNDNKFDIQLGEAHENERRLAQILGCAKIEKLELKSESRQWEQTGNIAIEYSQRGAPSGIAVTQAEWWVHELKRDGETLVYLWFPVTRLKELARDCFKRGLHRKGGDRREYEMVLVPLHEVLR
jgi:hypothetical protein